LSQLKRQLGLFDVFAVASGAMISSGLFVLPAIAYEKAGPASILSYLLASILIIPSVFSKAELATAMPKAGGTYFYVERSLGPAFGLFGGLANWFSLAMKSAFAILGMAILFTDLLVRLEIANFTETNVKQVAVLCCVAFTILNLLSVKGTGRLQGVLVAALLTILAAFVFFGAPVIKAENYASFFESGPRLVFATAGLVFISFGGVTKVAAISEEIKNPGKNIAAGMILAWLVVSVFYVTVVTVTIGSVAGVELSQSHAPISLAASKFMPHYGFILLSIAAIAAFVTTANGGLLAASRSPLAMSRDKLLPNILSKVNRRFTTPHISIILTSVFMVCAMIFLELELLVKTASTLMLILFIFDNASVIIMRESRIESYRPKFKSPLYPFLQIAAIIIYVFLLIGMGMVPLIVSGLFIFGSMAWYFIYVRTRVSRASAVMHLVERVTDRQLKTRTLPNELRDILFERDEIIKDRFDKLIHDCVILDVKGKKDAEEIFREVAIILAKQMDSDEYVLIEKFIAREEDTTTVVQPGLAIPHIIVEGENKFDIVLVRALDGVTFPRTDEPVKTMFFLAGTKDERNYHLRALMAIAQITQEKHFEKKWIAAHNTEEIRNLILLSTRKRDTAS